MVLSDFDVDKGHDKWVTPLGRVFKIHNIFLHYFIEFLTSINYMDKWVTPLGRVCKIHNIFPHGFIGCLLSVSGMLLWVTPLRVR